MTSDHTILVVDDDEDIRAALVDLLSDEGYSAVGLANGSEALAWLRSERRPFAILLDWMMPVMLLSEGALSYLALSQAL